MNQKEYDEALADAEHKLERLRAAYELYFQGMEKLEPTIQFKACERLFYVLVREKPRSTSTRFRANQLIQKWSTYQMYWRRVGRQIEEGTYRRQVEKARAKQSARRAEATAERDAQRAATQEARLAEAGRAPDGSWQIESSNIELDMDEFSFDDDPSVTSAVLSTSTAKEATPEKPVVAKKPEASADAADIPKAAEIPKTADLPDVGEKKEAAAPKDVKGGYKPPAPGGLKKKPTVESPTVEPKLAAPPAPAAAAPPAAAIAAAAKAPVAPPTPPAGAAAPPIPKAAPPIPKVAPPKPPPPGVKPVAAAPKPPPGLAPKPAPAPQASAVADTEVRKIYDRYVEARKKNNERVDNVKFEKIADQIRKMVPDLQKKHGGKKIDFDVVLKDGKVGIKPVAKDK